MIIPYHDKSRKRKKKNLTKKLSIFNAYINFKLSKVSNSRLAEHISNVKKIPMWIRIVYIPGITDKGDSLDRYKKFISTLKSVEKIEILPYHEMGKYKWKELGLKYELENIKIPDDADCKRIHDYLTN